MAKRDVQQGTLALMYSRRSTSWGRSTASVSRVVSSRSAATPLRQPGHPLPAAPQARTGRRDHLRMGIVGEQPARPVLRADRHWPAAASRRDARVGRNDLADGTFHLRQGRGPAMTALKRFAKRLAATLRMRTNDDSRVRDELAEHLALLTEEYRRAGHPSDEAHRLARIRLGAPDVIAEAYRDEQRLGWLETLASDVRFGLRALRRNPGFSIVAIATLALGMGANLVTLHARQRGADSPAPLSGPGELTLVHLLMPERGSPDVLARTIRSIPSTTWYAAASRSSRRRACSPIASGVSPRPAHPNDCKAKSSKRPTSRCSASTPAWVACSPPATTASTRRPLPSSVTAFGSVGWAALRRCWAAP